MAHDNITIVVKKAREEDLLSKIKVFNALLMTGILLINLSNLVKHVEVKTTVKSEE